MAAGRRRVRLLPLLLLAVVAAAAVQQVAAGEGADGNDNGSNKKRQRTPKPERKKNAVRAGLLAPAPAPKPGPRRSPKPPPKAAQPAAAPKAGPAPMPSPEAAPAPSPPPSPSPSPPPPAYPTSLLKLVLEVQGSGNFPLTEQMNQSMTQVLSAYVQPCCTFTVEQQRPAYPGAIVINGIPTKPPPPRPAPSPSPSPPPSPAPSPSPAPVEASPPVEAPIASPAPVAPAPPTEVPTSPSPAPETLSPPPTLPGSPAPLSPAPASSPGPLSPAPASPGPASPAPLSPAPTVPAPTNGLVPVPSGTGLTGRKLRSSSSSSVGGAARRSLLVDDGSCPTDTQAICRSDKHIVTTSEAACTACCEAKISGRTDKTITPETYAANGGLCCKCNIKANTEAAPAPEAAPAAPPDDNTKEWYPTDPYVTGGATPDGVFVFADAVIPKGQDGPAKIKLWEDSFSGKLCTDLAKSGVPCTRTKILFLGTEKITELLPSIDADAAYAATAGDADSSSGLSTGAIVGIVVGCIVVLAAIAMSIAMIISWRQERTINRAASLRMQSRRDSDPSPDGESKWRQMYSQRMAESMRRAEEATERQKYQRGGPSFVEAQDQAFGQQAQRSFRSTELSSSPSLQRDSIDHSLISGSELSSPSPGVDKPPRSRSLKKLFSSKG